MPWRRDRSYPHELSGGQKQRVMIAMALACDPQLLIADEPTTALDVMVQAQVLALLEDLQAVRGLAMVFITHDLSVLSTVADRLAVMYAGRIVEMGPAKAMLHNAKHPYSKGLAAAFPTIGDHASRLKPSGLPGDPPAPTAIPSGCSVPPSLPDRHGGVQHRHGRVRARSNRVGRRRASSCERPVARSSGRQGGLPGATSRRGRGPCRRWGRPRTALGRDRRSRRRERLRQDHAGPHDPRSAAVQRRLGELQGGHTPARSQAVEALPPPGSTRLPRSQRELEPAAVDLRDRRRGAAHPSHHRQRGTARRRRARPIAVSGHHGTSSCAIPTNCRVVSVNEW